MSHYEHQVHKVHGFEMAKNKTIILSNAAYNGECGNLQISKSREHIAFIPFYGGRPPGVTKDLAVKSIGQGNSLVRFANTASWFLMGTFESSQPNSWVLAFQVDGHTKGTQTMAVVCSCLKYFGHVVIGVARDEDRVLINDLVSRYVNYVSCHRSAYYCAARRSAWMLRT
jgi:hypothetical protein